MSAASPLFGTDSNQPLGAVRSEGIAECFGRQSPVGIDSGLPLGI
jgi:hypothetical protein